jgi:hypothetical protein
MVEGVSDEPCNHYLRPRLLAWCVNVSFALATANILLVCMMGGYRFTIGPLQVSASHLKNPLILFFSFAAVKIWFILKHREMPVFVKQTGLHSGDDLIPPTHERIEVRDTAFVLLIFLLSRGVVFSAMTVSPWFVAQSANPNIWHIEDSLLRPLFRWDAGWYLSIAQHGYSYSGNPTQHHNIAFLPLYPLLCRMCYEVTGLSIPQCAILLSNLTFLLGLLARGHMERPGSGNTGAGNPPVRAIVLRGAVPPQDLCAVLACHWRCLPDSGRTVGVYGI